MFVTNRPQPRQCHIQEWIDDYSIGNREESVSADGEDNRRNRDDGVGGVKISAQEEPRDPWTEPSPSKAPFMDMSEISGFPTRGGKAKNGHQRKKEQENAGGHDIEMGEHR